MAGIQSTTAEIRQGKERRRKRKKKPQDENVMVCPISQGDHKNTIQYNTVIDKQL